MLICYLIAGYILPLLPKMELIGHYKILLLMIACVVMIVWANPPIQLSEGQKKKVSDKGTMLLIFVLGYIALIAPIIEWAYFKIDNGWTIWTNIGVILIIGCLTYRIWSLQILGKYFTGVVQQLDGHQLVTKGPYKYLRHPSYTGSMGAFLGCAVLLEAWIGLLVAAIAMSIAYYLSLIHI